MPSIRFLTRDLDLELSGSESFVSQQLLLLSPYLGNVARDVLEPSAEDEAQPPQPVRPAPLVALPSRVAETAAVPASQPVPDSPKPVETPEGGPESGFAATEEARSEGLDGFFRRHEPQGADRQADAALLFAYYLQTQQGASSLELGDLIRCCIRTGVDTRNFNRTLGTLTRRGLLETVRHGRAYRLSEHGVAAVEQRL